MELRETEMTTPPMQLRKMLFQKLFQINKEYQIAFEALVEPSRLNQTSLEEFACQLTLVKNLNQHASLFLDRLLEINSLLFFYHHEQQLQQRLCQQQQQQQQYPSLLHSNHPVQSNSSLIERCPFQRSVFPPQPVLSAHKESESMIVDMLPPPVISFNSSPIIKKSIKSIGRSHNKTLNSERDEPQQLSQCSSMQEEREEHSNYREKNACPQDKQKELSVPTCVSTCANTLYQQEEQVPVVVMDSKMDESTMAPSIVAVTAGDTAGWVQPYESLSKPENSGSVQASVVQQPLSLESIDRYLDSLPSQDAIELLTRVLHKLKVA